HLIELALRERVELVIVTDRAVGGQAKPDRRHRLGTIARVEDEILLRNDAAFIRGDVAAVEAGRYLLIKRAAGQQVAGELIDGELVERLVLVEGANHPIAIGPNLTIVVKVDAVGVS